MKLSRQFGFILVVALTATVSAQKVQSPEVLLKAATTREFVDGDVTGAIAQYKDIAAKYADNHAVAAQALLQLGEAYQKIGAGDARAVFAQIVSQFADQKQVAIAARTRLAAFAPAQTHAEGLSPKRLVTLDSGVAGGVSDISADGHLAVATVTSIEGGAAQLGLATTDLAMTDLSTGQTTILVKGSPLESATDGILSGDARQVAYRWSERIATTPPQSRVSLRVVARAAGAQPVTVLRPDAGLSGIVPIAWSSDGKVILATTVGGSPSVWTIVAVSIADGRTRIIKTSPTPITGTRLSPDGRFLAYSTAPSGSTDRHIYSIDVAGQNETGLVKMAGSNFQPIWTPDGAHLLFVNVRAADRGLWSVAVQDGKTSGEPTLLQPDFRDSAIGMSLSGALYYQHVNNPGPMIYVAERPSSSRIAQVFSGMSAAWSPDGKSIGFKRGADLIVRTLTSGEEKLYRHDGIGNQSPRWLHDSSGFLVVINRPGMEPPNWFYRVDARTGTFTALFPQSRGSGIVALSPDDKTLYRFLRQGGADQPYRGIVGIDLETGAERPSVTFPEPGLSADSPGIAVSPDGEVLALMVWTTEASKRQARLMTVRVDGSGFREVHGPFGATRLPDLMRWTPDGQSLVFVTDAPGAWQVMRISARGGQPQLDGLESTKLNSSAPLPMLGRGSPGSIDLSPDGSRILFSAPTRITHEVWALENVMAVLNRR